MDKLIKIYDLIGKININDSFSTADSVKVQMKCFFIAEFERAAKIRKIAVYSFSISLLVLEL